MPKQEKKHSGGKVGEAGKTLATENETKKNKSEAAKILNDHKKKKH